MSVEYWEKRYKGLGGKKTVGAMAWGEEQYHREMDDFIKTVSPILDYRKYGSTLDFGCGIGRWSRFLKSISDKYYPCDIVQKMDDAELIRDSVIPFDDTKFDLIWSCVTLQHVTDSAELERYLKQFKERLNPGGWVVATENTLGIPSKDYIVYRNLSEYQDLFKSAGFELVEVKTHLFGTEQHSVMVYE